MTYRDSLRGLSIGVFLLLGACSTSVPEMPADESSHLSPEPASISNQEIPSVVATLPILSEPQLQEAPELYSVVAQNQSVRDILFAMARDASTNIDIHPSITGQISINAIDQTLPQILDRLAKQVNLRWSYDINNNLLVEPDSIYWRVYSIDYVNVERTSSTSASASSSMSAGGATNESNTTLTQTSNNSFWTTLTANLKSLIGEAVDSQSSSIVVNAESGLININANSRQHLEISTFLEMVHDRALQEVMIEATIVEVDLSDGYQSGVNWDLIGLGSDVQAQGNLLNSNIADNSTNLLTIDGSDLTGSVSLLSQFGDLRVLSSPKIMAINNQPAMLRVVDNKVYFSVDVTPEVRDSTGIVRSPAIYTTEVETVPVGFVMSITPQIGENNQITLNVRPTITRILRFVEDPNPALLDIPNLIPEIQVREIESVLKVYDGQIAVLGGLMQDSLEQNTTGLPGASRIPGIRNLFSRRDDVSKKTELVIFIRPVIVKQPSLNGDLNDYQNYLPESKTEFFNQNSYIQPLN